MLIRCALLFLFLNCVRTTAYIGNGYTDSRVAEFNRRFSLWPSVHNAAKLMRVRREAEKVGSVVQSEGGADVVPAVESPSAAPTKPPTLESKETPKVSKVEVPTSPPTIGNATVNNATALATNNETKTNATSTEKPVKQVDLSNPGVLKRGFIVFGGFALLAIAYFIFYRKKSNKNDASNQNTNDQNMFRYGVLESEDRRDNLELSRVPLTMESDEDEDEDLEIFDLEQKKKSLSYVNLQTNDEDVVFSSKETTDNDRDNLLLDIEDGTTDTLINWSSTGSKSIL